ncbi:MAG: stage III sporulation AC/AD family protein [Oscillospiraceae bacterium]|jgi:stage III sporulation protein AD|nr:stage III sporulation AC/AD family protein [Oscillospiraceae bacterium]
MTGLWKIAAAAVAGALAALAIRKTVPALALTLTLAVSAVILTLTASALTEVMAFLRRMAETADLPPELFLPVIKTVGIALVAKTAADICRDAGQTAVASATETAGVIVALYLTLPLFTKVVDLVTSLV